MSDTTTTTHRTERQPAQTRAVYQLAIENNGLLDEDDEAPRSAYYETHAMARQAQAGFSRRTALHAGERICVLRVDQRLGNDGKWYWTGETIAEVL